MHFIHRLPPILLHYLLANFLSPFVMLWTFVCTRGTVTTIFHLSHIHVALDKGCRSV